MNCEELNGLLDALLDDALTEEQRQAMIAHGRDCRACAEAIRATMRMKALFAEMPAEVEVPLKAQANWRGAVREEARRRRGRRLTRWIGTAAAAVVVLVGVGFALNARNAPRMDAATLLAAEKAAPEAVEYALDAGPEESMAYETMEETAAFGAAQSAVVEADGVAGDYAEDAAETAALAPACEIDLRVEDVDAACKLVEDLAEEYEGNADVQRVEDGGANVYVSIDAQNAADFLNAVTPMGADAPVLPDLPDTGELLILLVLR